MLGLEGILTPFQSSKDVTRTVICQAGPGRAQGFDIRGTKRNNSRRGNLERIKVRSTPSVSILLGQCQKLVIMLNEGVLPPFLEGFCLVT